VAIITLLCETNKLVIRLRGLLIILFMTTLAVKRQACILPSDMTLLAFRHLMCTGQTEIRIVVIELRRFPLFESVTLITTVVELPLLMIWERDLCVILFMARPAVRCERTVLSIDMAFLTFGSLMRPKKREIRDVVIECGRFPRIEPMAFLAIVIELSLFVIR